MTRKTVIEILLCTSVLAAGCGGAPGRRGLDAENVTPDGVLDFDVLYGSNCAGCHGVLGRGGAATALGDPVYLAIADEAAVRRATADGITGTPMPAFGRRSGGLLTDQQIDSIVTGMRARWASRDAVAATDLPAYVDLRQGDGRRGADVFAIYCASCHGAEGRGTPAGSAIVDGSFLALASDQGLRTTVIAGRPDLGAPDWRENVRGRSMTAEEITDVVAWLSAKRAAVSTR